MKILTVLKVIKLLQKQFGAEPDDFIVLTNTKEFGRVGMVIDDDRLLWVANGDVISLDPHFGKYIPILDAKVSSAENAPMRSWELFGSEEYFLYHNWMYKLKSPKATIKNPLTVISTYLDTADNELELYLYPVIALKATPSTMNEDQIFNNGGASMEVVETLEYYDDMFKPTSIWRTDNIVYPVKIKDITKVLGESNG